MQTLETWLAEKLENSFNKLKEDGFTGIPKISVYDLENKVSANVNGDQIGWAASIIKLPILVAASQEIVKGKLGLKEELVVNPKFQLEYYDLTSSHPRGTKLPVYALLDYMMTLSDNEATNMLANRIGIEKINEYIWKWGMKNTMLGHLLCPKVPRYTSSFNPDGSNITTPEDMTLILKHIYNPKSRVLGKNVKRLSDIILSLTSAPQINFDRTKTSKGKNGYIHDPKDGADIHEVGIIEDKLIVSVMINKFHYSEGYYSQKDEYSPENWREYYMHLEEKRMISPEDVFSKVRHVLREYNELKGELKK